MRYWKRPTGTAVLALWLSGAAAANTTLAARSRWA